MVASIFVRQKILVGPAMLIGLIALGVLWNHLWRVAGGSGRPNVNADFIQPFLTYNTKDGWTYAINTEATYDWTGNHWDVPITPYDFEDRENREAAGEFRWDPALLGHKFPWRSRGLRTANRSDGTVSEEMSPG